jgi:hypothetical protein
MMARRRIALAQLAALLVPLMAVAQSPAPRGPAAEFAPDYVFRGSQLTGWRSVGQASWKAENGELVGTVSPGGTGGWLVLDKSYEDLSLFSRFRCSAPCSSGLLLRAQQTPQGMSGLFVSLADGDLAPYQVTIDPQGRILTREKLKPAAEGSHFGAAPPNMAAAQRAAAFAAGRGEAPEAPAAPRAAAPGAAAAGGAGAGGGGGGGRAQVQVALRTGDWNDLKVITDAAYLTANLNGAGVGTGSTADGGLGYGTVALYLGAPGEVRFKDLALKDEYVKLDSPEKVSSRFRMQKLDEFYYAWDAAVADVNRDGVLDVIAGPYYYLGPDYSRKREIYTGVTFSPAIDYVGNMVTHAFDWTGDGYADVLASEVRPMVLYVNPGQQNRRWQRFEVIPGVSAEITVSGDLDGDGVPEIVYGGGGTMNYAKVDRANPTKPWAVHKISDRNPGNHGAGIGDVNQDGRPDILGAAGWWEQPPRGSTQEPWTFHVVAFGGRGGGGEMAVFDVNGDKLNDVVTSLAAHGFGLAWYEQKKDAAGAISFVEHMIMDSYATSNAGGVTFSQLHAGVVPADFDGDGVLDFVTGKRYWAHLETFGDVDPNGEPVIYWYRTVRDASAPGGARFVPELIHNRSGVGSLIKVADLNKDGAPDIVTSATRGTFIFWGTPARKR